MNYLDGQILSILSMDLIRQLANGEPFSYAQYCTLNAIMVSNNIPFDVSFSPATRRHSPSIQLTIYINPSSTLVFDINFENAPGTFNQN